MAQDAKRRTDKLFESHLIATPLMKHLHDEFWVDRYKNYAGDEVLGTVMKVPGSHWYVAVERDIAAQVLRALNAGKVKGKSVKVRAL